MVKKIMKRVIVILEILVFGSFIIFGNAGANIISAYAAEDLNDDKVLYLSDTTRIKHDASKSKSLGNSRLFMAPENVAKIPGGSVQAKIEGSWYTFKYGVYAHGPSYVAFNISDFSQKYKYFSAYAGILSSATKSDGALFYVQFSEDGNTWVTQAASDTTVTTDTQGRQLVNYNQNFLYFTLDVTGVKWIRLVADKNKSDAQDYVVWADAKLTNSLDEGANVKPLASYDEKIKAFGVNANLDDPEVELLVLQREFVSRVGQYALKRFMGESEDNKVMMDWLLNDLDSLREFMLGGTPFKGNYYNSLTVLSNLYKSYKKDLEDDTLLGYNHTGNKWMPNRTFGELCRTMMFSVALTHDGAIGSYLQGTKPENKSYPLQRYAIFKYMYQTERFVATRNANGSWKSETMSWFESYRVEEMRWLMCNIIDDESILWLNDQVQTRINANPGNVGNLYTPHPYVKYTDPNYNNPVFYADENHEYFNNQFAVDYRGDNAGENWAGGKRVGMFDTKYIVPAGEGEEPYEITISYSKQGEPKLQKVWMNFSNKFGTGSVCGGISKSGTNIRTVRGIPANVIGQPGHAAILYYGKDANGHGSWKIDNDVGGWLAATKGERHLLGWGSDSWQRNSGGTVVYFHLAQACLNDYDNLVRAEEYTWLAKVYQGDLKAQETLYEKALKTQILNLDAWYGLVQTYKANSAKTAENFVNLAKRIGDTYYNHPVAMHCLFKLFGVKTNIAEVDAALTSPLFNSQLKTIEINTLAKTKTSGSTAAKSKVNYLLGNVDLSVADFSFDGENAGCIVWSNSYSDSSFAWKYSLDGKKTWKEVVFNENDSHAYPLSEKELATISTDNDIYVYIVGASPDDAYRIDVAAKPTMPDTLYANDWENRVMGVDGTYEWRYCTSTISETDSEITYTPTTGWISYAEASPNCSGDKIIEVRLKGTAKKPASDGKIFIFTADTDTAERKYISVNYLSMVEFSTESQDAKRPNYAINAIDGNAKTYWHTDYTVSIKNPGVDEKGENKPYAPAYLIIKLDVPRYISGLEFVQTQYNSNFSIFAKNVTVYVSEDGKKWKEAGKREGFEEIDDLKVIPFTETVYGQYVKLVMDDLYETNTNDGVFTTVSMINLYEDTTKTLSPTGETMPSLSEIDPSGNVFEGLGEIIDEDKALIIGGEPTDEMETSPKSNTGLWIALSVVGGVVIVAAVVFVVLYKRGIIKFKDKKNTDKASKPKTDTTETKASTAKPKATTESKVSTAKPKATTESKASTAKPKAATETKVSTAKPKAATETKVSTAKPKAATETKASTAKPKATTETKASTTKSKTNKK
ncbi:hypothetical protein HDR67_03675 [bacterium]|nr:hypothetical protein [bacterium]